MYRILICDDDKDILSALRIFLTTEGYTVVSAESGAQALDILQNMEIHLVLLDVMMPELDGLSTLKALREWSNIPVILLTAKSEEEDKVEGLGLGADDYICKPFSNAELLARVRSQLRRYLQLGCGVPHNKQLVIGAIRLDDDTKQVHVDGEPVSLTPLEYDILRLLMQNPNMVFSPKEIYRIVWKETPMGAENAVAVHIRHIREKIEIDPAEPRYLKVVWGKGYKIQA